MNHDTKRKRLALPLSRQDARKLRAGDFVYISGTIYTARDAAHKRLLEEIREKKEIAVPLLDLAIYYAGPCPAPPGAVIGSIGPTTSGRMDAYAPELISMGQTVMVGKGLRKKEVIDAMKEFGAVYLGATGGAGALLAQRVVSAEIVMYPDLGAEAIRKLEIQDFPAVVLIDSDGNSLYSK